MTHWHHALRTPPAVNEDVLVVYYPTAAGRPRRAIGHRCANGEWRLQQDGGPGRRRAVIAWAPLLDIPETLEATA